MVAVRNAERMNLLCDEREEWPRAAFTTPPKIADFMAWGIMPPPSEIQARQVRERRNLQREH